MKVLGITLLCIASLAVLLGLVFPVFVTQFLGLGIGIDVPGHWTAIVNGLLSYPWIRLLAGLLLLSVFGWGIWKPTH